MKGVRLRGDGGFTLLEIIIVIILLGVVGLSFAYLYSSSQRFMIQSLNFTSSQTDASFALEHIKRHVTPATAVTLPAAGASGNQLQFTWQPNAAATPRTSRYELNGTDLHFIPDVTNAGTFEVIARDVQSLTFNRATTGMVSVDVIAQKSSGGDSRQMHLQTNVSPRGFFR